LEKKGDGRKHQRWMKWLKTSVLGIVAGGQYTDNTLERQEAKRDVGKTRGEEVILLFAP